MANEDVVMLSFKVPPKLREEFAVAAKLEGMDSSNMLRHFMIKTVREVRSRDPQVFDETLAKEQAKSSVPVPVKNIFTDETKSKKKKA